MRDPRYYQIVCLGLLLAYGIIILDFNISLSVTLWLIVTSELFQWAFSKIYKLDHFDPKSVLISALSLCLLLRTDSMLIISAAAFIAVGSKFLIRYQGKHIFNPSNFALVVLLLATNGAWVSHGQWGQSAVVVFFAACAGMLVLYRSRRTDITITFLSAYSLILLARAFWLNDPIDIPLHQLQNGALLIFAFFMISDPKSIPNARSGRLIFAILVAATAVYYQYYLYISDGLLYALVTCAPLVPLLDRILPSAKFRWIEENSIVMVKNQSPALQQRGHST